MSLADESRDVIRLALFIPGGRQLARAIERKLGVALSDI